MSPELAAAMTLNVKDGSSDEMDDMSMIGSIDSNFVVVEESLLNLDDYEPPESFRLAVMEAERMMNDVLFSSDQVDQQHVSVASSDNDDIAVSPILTLPKTNNYNQLTYSQAKRMAFSPLVAPPTVERANNSDVPALDQALNNSDDDDDDDDDDEAFLPPSTTAPTIHSNGQTKTNKSATKHIFCSTPSPTATAKQPIKQVWQDQRERTQRNNQQSLTRTTPAATRASTNIVKKAPQSPNPTQQTQRQHQHQHPATIHSKSATKTTTTLSNIAIATVAIRPTLTSATGFKPTTNTRSPNITMTATQLAKTPLTKPPQQPRSRTAPRSLTTPISPNFTTTARLGKPPIPRLSTSPQKTTQSVSTTASRSPTRPISPNFTTTARLGKPLPKSSPAQVVVTETDRAHSTTTTPKLTIPRPPRLSTSERHGCKVYSTTNPNNNNNITMTPASLPKRTRETITIPKTPMVLKRPNSSSSRTTSLPTQTKRELEEIAYMASHKFKARPMPDMTTMKPSSSSSLLLLPLRRTNNNNNNNIKTPRKQNTMESRRLIPPPLPPPSADEIELSKKFKARPLPKFLVNAATRATPNGTSTPFRSSKKCLDPDYASKPRIISIPRGPVLINTKQMQRGIVTQQDGGDDARPAPTRPTIPEPFVLESEKRGAMYREQLQERIRQDEQKRKDVARGFKAKPVPRLSTTSSSSRRIVTPSTLRGGTFNATPLTEFCLQTELRHELYQANLESKIEADNKYRMLESRGVKPLPIPKTLYRPGFKPTVPSSLGREPIRGFSPHLETNAQSKRRQSFDQEVNERKKKEDKIKQLMHKEEELESDHELRELRRLPANEGGFNPVINPTSSLLPRIQAPPREITTTTSATSSPALLSFR